MTRIAVVGLSKQFDHNVAIDSMDLTIPSGELFFLLGPSGSGKTTFLRMLAGLTEPDAGRIRFDGADVTAVAPHKRGAAMVFQSYALWPHMTVLENVAYGLRIRKVPRAQRGDRVMAALRSVRMEPMAGRKPGQLSGGEQQRVALARALVVKPRVLLLDEPLSNLDAALRLEMRLEIRRICTETRVTTVYVTHDQKEALSMADTVAVQRDGRIVQVGAPRELYERPCCRFVAGFVGETNFLRATVVRAAAELTMECAAGRLRSAAVDSGNAPAVGDQVICSIRPESFRILDSPAGNGPADPVLKGRLTQIVYMGEFTQQIVELEGGDVVKVLQLNPSIQRTAGDVVDLAVRPQDIVIVKE